MARKNTLQAHERRTRALMTAPMAAFGVLLAGVLAAALTPVVLSYIWYRQKVDKDGRR